MTYSGNGRGNSMFRLFTLNIFVKDLNLKIFSLGRGRGQISIFDQLESPGLSKEVHETDISSNASELSDLNVSFRSLASVDSTTDVCWRLIEKMIFYE